MPPPAGCSRRTRLAFAAVAFPLLAGCSSIGDLGFLQDPVITDDMHSWVGREAAARYGAPVSLFHLTDDERLLRDLAFPLIEPPYDRQRWDAVLYEYGVKREFQRALIFPDPGAYYRQLLAANYRSAAGRYNRLIDDVRNDVVRMDPFFDVAHRVLEQDQRRQQSLPHVPDVGATDRLNAMARVGENALTVVWVQSALAQRCAAYRFALDHLIVGEPENAAAQADLVLVQLQQHIAANQLVQPPSLPRVAGPPPGPIVK